PRQHASLDGFLDRLADGVDVLLGDGTALDLVDELDPAPGRQRPHPQPDVAVLTAAAALADVLALRLDLFGDGLAVGDLRLADVGLDLVLAQYYFDDDVEVQVAHR